MQVAFGGGAVVASGIALLLAMLRLPVGVPGLVAVILAVCALLFYSLSVTVSTERITLRFGIGLIRTRCIKPTNNRPSLQDNGVATVRFSNRNK